MSGAANDYDKAELTFSGGGTGSHGCRGSAPSEDR
jgi:hypothetical protein